MDKSLKNMKLIPRIIGKEEFPVSLSHQRNYNWNVKKEDFKKTFILHLVKIIFIIILSSENILILQ